MAETQKKRVQVQKEPESSPPDRLAEPVDAEQSPRLEFAVVGMGASAGGVEAFTEFFDAMPSDSGLAFVLIQHLPPQRESMMADILSKHTKMSVEEVENGMAVKPNHVYVIRPGHTLTIKNGKLHLGQPLNKPGHGRPVDDFFRSLAEEQQERAIAVILSGMGSNGSLGAQEIKAVGGVCIAQDPESAKFPSMPKHLIDSGMADFVLRPQEMPDVLMRYSEHPYVSGGGRRAAEAMLRRERQQFNDILAILRTRMRQDFSGYKKPTILRRIQRRMGLNQVTKLGDYVKILRQTPAEVTALSDDLMIHVTGFFRDPDAWETLRQRVIVPLVHDREPESPIRCWVSACSSGEEAYTLAMLLMEACEVAGKALDIKIFATDTAERSLSLARNGLYPGGIESEISPQRLDRFFEKEDAVYRVKKEVREAVVFAPQNLLNDPPFSKLDIITCRNLLIYLEPDLQRRVLSLLHFGLREGGALFLGTSETASSAEDLFEPVDKKWRIFRRVGPTRHGTIDFPLHPIMTSAERDSAEQRLTSKASVPQVTNRTLLEHYTPASVTIDRQHRVVYFHGNTDQYLSNPRGEPTRDILAIVREGVRGALRTALQKVVTTGRAVTVQDGTIEHKERGRLRISVTVAPLEPRLLPGYLLVNFTEAPEAPQMSAPGGGNGDRHIQDELRRAREELQSTVEELQTSNEELKASNEEVTSINEELQSTNEELETSKEELQSLNEELTTVNSQLQAKMDELEATSNDLSSLLSSTDIAVIFLDTQFRIRRFTPAIKDLIDLIPSDVGRPLNDLAKKFTDPNLLEDARTVLEKLVPIGREIVSNSGRWYMRRALPYRTNDNRIDGVVITFVEITERKAAEESLRQAKQAAEDATRTKDEFLATLSHELRTPLSAILLWVKMLRDRPSNTAQLMEGLDAIDRSAESQKSLIDDLLDTSRITAGKLRLEPRDVNLATLMESACEGINLAAVAKGITVECHLDETAGIVHVDAERLTQVINNLLSNAVKFTPEDGKVSLDLKRNGDEVEIRVVDTGQGINPDFLPHLFSRFRQEDASATRRHGGLGLGLAISKQLVDLFGGTIEAASDGPGHGATFTIRLPLPRIEPPPGFIDAPLLHAAHGPAQMNGFHGAMILVVEDEADTRAAVTKLLEQAGALPTAVESASEAIESFKAARPALIVSDLGLPETDGIAMLRTIRQMEAESHTPPVPAVALTAFARDEDRTAAIDAGFQQFLSKPVQPELLLSVLHELYSNRDGANC